MSIHEWGFFLPGALLGLLLAAALAMLGVTLRLRAEAVAAFSYTQVAVLGAMLALLWHLPPWLGAWLLALLAGLGLLLLAGGDRDRSGQHLGLLAVAWALSLLVADNVPEARMLGTSAIEGQLLLIRWQDWPSFLLPLLAALILFMLVGRRWLADQIVPWQPVRPGPRLRRSALRETAVISLLAAGALGLGVLLTLALIVLPAWAVWDRASSFRRALVEAAVLAVVAQLIALVIALALDQIHAAVLVLVLAVLCGAWRFWPGAGNPAPRER
ncbi:MAG: metal ABC transporter permease [Halothiobacillaceae bacterium]